MTGLTLLLLLINFACATAFTFLLYKNLFKDKVQSILACFRFLSFFLLGLLLINPKFESIDYTLEKPKLVIAFDDSESVAKLGNPEEINNFLKQLKADNTLNNIYDLNLLSFGESISTSNDTLHFNKPSTDISTAIDYANSIKEENSSFILVSDGNQTMGEDYRFKSFQNQLDVDVMILGDTTSYVDSKIDLVNVNSYAYLNNKFPVEVFVSQNTNSPTKQTLSIKEKGKVLASKPIEIPAKGSLKSEILIEAKPLGQKYLEVELEALDEEENQINNKKTVSLEVIDSRFKILLLSDILHPDVSFFSRVLENSKDLELEYKTTQDAFELSSYNLVILYQPQSTFLNVIQSIQDKGINYFIVGGSHTDYRTLNALGLDVNKELIASTEEYSAKKNSDFSLFVIDDLNVANYPPLLDQFGDLTYSSTYSVLLNKELNGIDVEMPLWIFRTKDNIKSSIIFGENLWRWRAKHFMDFKEFESFDRSYQKIIQYLAQSETKNSLLVEVDAVINSGDSKDLILRYYNSNFESDVRFDFDISLENNSTGETQVSRLLKDEDLYKFNLSNLNPGNYTYEIKSEDTKLTKQGEIEVLDYSVELQFENANASGLIKLVTSEHIYMFDERELLISKLKDKNPKTVQKSTIKIKSLINFEWLIILLALTLTFEWFFRKYKGLI